MQKLTGMKTELVHLYLYKHFNEPMDGSFTVVLYFLDRM